jgi:hypothetical protein
MEQHLGCEELDTLRPAPHSAPAADKTAGSPYKTAVDRNKDFLRDLSFNCNLRFLARAYTNMT